MFKPHTVLTIGLWLIAVSLLGIPSVWKVRLYILTGIVFVLVYLYHLGHETILTLAKQHPRSADTFTENGGTNTGSGPTPNIQRKP